MKKFLSCVISASILLFSFAACANEENNKEKTKKETTETIEITCGEEYIVENSYIEEFDHIIWRSDDEDIATVKDGTICGVSPGKTCITAGSGGGIIAKYYVDIITIPATSIVLSTNTCEISVGETHSLTYTLFPDNATNYGLTWKSADESVAKVDSNGEISAIAEGQTTISISNSEGFIATCSVNVKKAPVDFTEVYEDWCDPEWASLGWDASYLTIDTNPYDIDEFSYYSVWTAIEMVNLFLGLPDSLSEKMASTRALDGTQIQEYDGITITWTYHPDQGLEVIYEAT